MPCTMHSDSSPGDWGDSEARRKADEAIAAANKMADILCRVLRALPPDVVARMDGDVKSWFEQHKTHDAREGR